MKLRASPLVDAYGRQQAAPLTPQWFADAVETYAREWGRHASTRWEGYPHFCFVSCLSRRSADRVLERRPEDEGEKIYWNEWKEGVRRHPISGTLIGGYVALDIEQMGADAVLKKLRSENTLGRGEFASHEAAADAVQERNALREQDLRTKLADALKGPLKATIRHAKGHAQASVPDNITPRS